MANDWNQTIIDEFRANGGKVGGQFEVRAHPEASVELGTDTKPVVAREAQGDRTQEFYGRLFGWTVEDPGEEYGGYFNFLKDGVRVAGGMRNDGESGVPDLWSVYLATAADATGARFRIVAG